jgi:peptide/nickel transport system permease protein
VTAALARVGQYALVIWVAATMNFALPHLAPGDPVQYLYGGDSLGLSPAQLAQIRAQYGLDQPLLTQYARFWTGLTHGDLGNSVSRNQPVLDVVARQLPWTLALVGCGLVLASVFGISLGALAGWWRGTPKRGRRDTAMLTGVLAVDSMPAFWVGMVLVAVFAVWLGWLPSYGALDIDAHGWALLGQVCQRLALPAVTLALAQLGAFFLLTRASMASVRDEPFVRMARGLGMSERRVLFGAALPAALLPVATNASVELGRLLSGTVVIETVFAYPGLGRLIYDAVLARDYPLLSGTFLLVTVGVVLLNLVADLSYPLLDPRVRRARQALA